MKNKVLIIIAAVLFVIVLILLNVFLNSQNKLKTDLEISKEEESVVEVLKVTSENFEEEVLNSDKTVLIDFYADWCGPCKVFSPIFEKVSQELEDVKFVRVNVDEEPELANKYMAYSIPYIVVIENGEVVNSHTGLVDEEALKQLIKN